MRDIFDWFRTGTEFCKQSIYCGKWHLFIPINNTYHVCFWHSITTYSGLLYNPCFQQHFLFVFAVPMSTPESNRNCNRTGSWILSLFLHNVKKWSFIRFVLVLYMKIPWLLSRHCVCKTFRTSVVWFVWRWIHISRKAFLRIPFVYWYLLLDVIIHLCYWWYTNKICSKMTVTFYSSLCHLFTIYVYLACTLLEKSPMPYNIFKCGSI